MPASIDDVRLYGMLLELLVTGLTGSGIAVVQAHEQDPATAPWVRLPDPLATAMPRRSNEDTHQVGLAVSLSVVAAADPPASIRHALGTVKRALDNAWIQDAGLSQSLSTLDVEAVPLGDIAEHAAHRVGRVTVTAVVQRVSGTTITGA